MSQNLLPFEWREMRRYGLSWHTLKLLFLRISQTRSFQKAGGVVFLTRYAQDAVLKVTGLLQGKMEIIPHGIDGRFFRRPRVQRSLAEYSEERPFRLVYVSIIGTYKHQWHVAEAVSGLRQKGFPVHLDLVGPVWPSAMRRLRNAMQKHDPLGHFIQYHGPIPYAELHGHYHQADAFIFASSCENLPNILLEAMAAGLPIACSRRGPMPEVAGDAVTYFDPEEPEDIARALEELLLDPGLRAMKAKIAFERAGLYSWERCAHETFRFLAGIADAT